MALAERRARLGLRSAVEPASCVMFGPAAVTLTMPMEVLPTVPPNITERAHLTRHPFKNMFPYTDRLASLIDDNDFGKRSPALSVNIFHCVSQAYSVPHIDRL